VQFANIIVSKVVRHLLPGDIKMLHARILVELLTLPPLQQNNTMILFLQYTLYINPPASAPALQAWWAFQLPIDNPLWRYAV
jgi:hypothetical protein